MVVSEICDLLVYKPPADDYRKCVVKCKPTMLMDRRNYLKLTFAYVVVYITLDRTA